ncbi:MAG: hypothetical protein LKF52_02405 [Butyrivibrio sp.]|jgi:hypothetical protein|nr:hypothetical protein [Butyrivibrio sp.]
MLSIYLCKRDETIADALKKINETDPDGKVYAVDEDTDRCYVGDERFVHAPKLINCQNHYWAVREVTSQ